MSYDHDPLEAAFGAAKERACAFIDDHNRALPSGTCPRCGDEAHVPGLVCPGCGYRHADAWAILRETEWGYEAVPISNLRRVLREFRAAS